MIHRQNFILSTNVQFFVELSKNYHSVDKIREIGLKFRYEVTLDANFSLSHTIFTGINKKKYIIWGRN